ncbi:MAG: hypothetical protein QOG50_1743 [Actinomycetota bacterium]|nr:hypothetical protein [Actinomycetota bacterium]
MAKRRSEVVAASLLTAWTDADTAMQIVGASLGVFGVGLLDPTVVLATETPLRNALFDVLLSLVEGGALEIRATDDHGYAFRWRDDLAVAGLVPDGSPAIDLAVPSPYLSELKRAHTERDEALGRADFAEALAAERERLLRLAGVRSPGGPPVAGRRVAVSALDTRDESVLDVLYAHPVGAAHAKSVSTWDESPARKPAARKTAAKRAAPKKPDPDKGPRKPARAKVAAAINPEASELDLHPTTVLFHLTPPAADATPDIDLTAEENGSAADAGEQAPPPKWSGYAIDRGRKHLAGVDRLADDD